jgi:chorismate dehydratase
VRKKLKLSLRPKVNDLKKIKIGAVNYLNTKPLLYGIRNHEVINHIDLIEDYPSRIADMIIRGEADIGLIPVATLPLLNNWRIIGNYGIACNGPVASVCLFSDVPISEIKEVYLDYQSRTSVMLLKILMQEYWNQEVKFIPAGSEEFLNKIKGTTAGLVIGDRALEQRKNSKFIYDLGEAWKEHTGLPFVFAAWISNKEIDPKFVSMFDDANKLGVENKKYVYRYIQYPHYDLRHYFEKNISYFLDEQKKEGLQLFLEKLSILQNF